MALQGLKYNNLKNCTFAQKRTTRQHVLRKKWLVKNHPADISHHREKRKNRHSPNVGIMMTHHLPRWPYNSKTTLEKSLMFAGMIRADGMFMCYVVLSLRAGKLGQPTPPPPTPTDQRWPNAALTSVAALGQRWPLKSVRADIETDNGVPARWRLFSL